MCLWKYMCVYGNTYVFMATGALKLFYFILAFHIACSEIQTCHMRQNTDY